MTLPNIPWFGASSQRTLHAEGADGEDVEDLAAERENGQYDGSNGLHADAAQMARQTRRRHARIVDTHTAPQMYRCDTHCLDELALQAYTQYLLDVAADILVAIPSAPEGPAICGLAAASVAAALRVRLQILTQAMQQDVSYSVLVVALLYILRYRQNLMRPTRRLDRHAGGHEQRRDYGNRHTRIPSTDSTRHAAFYAGYAPFPRDLLLLGALLLASKYTNDQHQLNAHWASALGLPAEVVNGVERHVLAGTGHRMHVGPDGFAAWVAFLFDSRRLHSYLASRSHR